jgi:hypothetical protein
MYSNVNDSTFSKSGIRHACFHESYGDHSEPILDASASKNPLTHASEIFPSVGPGLLSPYDYKLIEDEKERKDVVPKPENSIIKKDEQNVDFAQPEPEKTEECKQRLERKGNTKRKKKKMKPLLMRSRKKRKYLEKTQK